MAFVIWCLCGCLFIGLGVFAFFSKKPVGFWANVKTFAVNDEKVQCGDGKVVLHIRLGV